MAEVLSKIPKHCFVKDTAKSLMYAAISTALTVGCGVLAYLYLPLKLAFLPAWIAYAFVAGTCATGCWVVAHECGHGAFSDNKLVQDTVGYVLHSLLLVPYFSWQRSHAVHHSRTNHVMEGETHVPARINTDDANVVFKLRSMLGEGPFTFLNLVGVFLLGWPIYLLTGASGGPVRGATNHFNPNAGEQGKYALFGEVARKGVAVRRGRRGGAGRARRVGRVRGIRLARRRVVPRTVPRVQLLARAVHLAAAHRRGRAALRGRRLEPRQGGAFMTIDRPYGPVLDFLHHRIGSTPRCAPHQPHHPALSREGGDGGAHGGVPGPVPVRPDAHRDRHLARGEQVHRGVQAGNEWVFTDERRRRAPPR